MYELIQVSDTCYYIQSPARIGLIRLSDHDVCLIDSGNDKDAGKKIRKILDTHGWTIRAIYNTHSHADHIGGNQYLQKQTGCRIYAPGIERNFTEHPILEPAFLYGACPPEELRHKFLMAAGSEAFPLTEECMPEGMVILPLPGHSWDMVGFRTKDDIVYLADALASDATLSKYQISFLVDVGAYLSTLESILTMDARLFIPAHAEPTEHIADLVRLNIRKVQEIAESIRELYTEPSSFESILKRLFEKYQLTMTFEQHALVGSTVRSYLTWLTKQGSLKMFIEDNTLLWSV